jgi:hypothetical protein
MIIVIPFNVPWKWSTDYLNQTAFELAKKGHIVVCYLWADIRTFKDIFRKKNAFGIFQKYTKNIYIVNPIFFIPLRRYKFVTDLNSAINLLFLRIITEFLSIKNKCRKKIFWIFDPNLLFMYSFFRKRYFLLYDCVDFFAIGSPKTIAQTVKNEKMLVKRANLVTANSTILHDHLLRYRSDIVLVPQGFRIDNFVVNKKKYIDLKIAKPIIGFVGGINDRLDLSILLPLIRNNPKWNFVLWGPVQMREKISNKYWNKLQEILNLPNVKFGSSSDKEEIPGLISQFDVCIIPYDISQDFNKYCYPMKLFEYFFLGKPVVSTGILELKRFSGLVKIGTNCNEWQSILNKLILGKWSKNNMNKELIYAKENSWKNKIKVILNNVYAIM